MQKSVDRHGALCQPVTRKPELCELDTQEFTSETCDRARRVFPHASFPAVAGFSKTDPPPSIMKATTHRNGLPCGLLSLALLGWLVSSVAAAAQGTSFTYQGRAVYQGYSANGNLDMTFGLFDAASGGTQIGSTITNLDVAVSNGLFTATFDFGGTAFPGADRWLELGVRTNGSSGAFATLSPRQKLTPAPYAVTAAGFTGTVQDSQALGQCGAAQWQSNIQRRKHFQQREHFCRQRLGPHQPQCRQSGQRHGGGCAALGQRGAAQRGECLYRLDPGDRRRG